MVCNNYRNDSDTARPTSIWMDNVHNIGLDRGEYPRIPRMRFRPRWAITFTAMLCVGCSAGNAPARDLGPDQTPLLDLGAADVSDSSSSAAEGGTTDGLVDSLFLADSHLPDTGSPDAFVKVTCSPPSCTASGQCGGAISCKCTWSCSDNEDYQVSCTEKACQCIKTKSWTVHYCTPTVNPVCPDQCRNSCCGFPN